MNLSEKELVAKWILHTRVVIVDTILIVGA